MGANLDRLMKSYGVSTPSVAGYSGHANPAALAADATPEQQGANAADLARYKADQDAYNKYAADYKNRITSTDLYSSPYMNILPKAQQKTSSDAVLTSPDYSTIVSPITDVKNIKTTPDYDALVKSAYAGVGRSGIGAGANNIDQAGYDYWLGQLKNGVISPSDFNSVFSSSVKDYVTKNPTNPITTVVQNYQPTNKTNPAYESLINSAYSGIGRTGIGANTSNIDQAGYNYWMNQLNSGAINPSNFNSTFANSAKEYVGQNPNDNVAKYMQGYLGLSAADLAKANQANQTSQNVQTVQNLTNTTDPYSVAVVQNSGYSDPNNPDSTFSHGGKVKHFYGGGVNRTDGGINDLADKYALDNPAELPVIYAQNETNTATDAAPPVKLPVNDSVSPPSGTVPISDARLQDLQASAVRNGVPPMTRGPIPPMGEGDGGGAETTLPRVAAAPQGRMSLEDLLKRYTPQQSAYSAELAAATKKSNSETEAFRKMIMDSASKGDEGLPSKAEMYFRLAAAFAAPTKTGNIFDNVALGAKELGDYQKDVTSAKRAQKASNLQLALKAQELSMQSAKDELSTLRNLAGEENKDRRQIAQEMIKEYVRSGEAQSAAGKQAIDEGFIPKTPEYQKRVEEISKLSVDSKMAQINSQLENMRRADDKANLDREKWEAAKKQQAIKDKQMTTKEITMKEASQSAIDSADQSLKNLDVAFKLNPNAFDSTLLDIAQRKLLENTKSDDPKVIATRRLENLLTGDALQKLKSTFGGNPSNKEGEILLRIQGIGAKSKKEREEILLDLYEAIKTRREKEVKKLKDINDRKYRDYSETEKTEGTE